MNDFDPERFLFVKIQDSAGPLDREDKYEGPLAELLAEHRIGKITGGGSQLGEDDAEGNPTIAFCGVDVDAIDRDAAVLLLREHLPALGAPVGTEIHYTCGGTRLQDELRSEGWSTGLPRTFLHPYFEC